MTIYTKKGDRGITRLCDGLEISKDNGRIEAIGAIDELGAYLGLIKASQPPKRVSRLLETIQPDLMGLNSYLARYPGQKAPRESQIKEIETVIDKITQEVPLAKDFVIPGKTQLGSLFHISRTIGRRAERELARLARCEVIAKNCLVYLNRLSDLLFVLAVYCDEQSS